MDFDYVVMPAVILVVGILVAWMCVRRMLSLSSRGYGKWRRVVERIVLSTVVVLVAAVAGSSTFNAIAIRVFRATNPPMGNLYTVNGHKMQLFCMGTGSPTIVLESGLGLGTDLLSWGGLQPELAKTTHVCSYDRAGLGWSEPQPGPSDADHIAANLHELLAQAKVSGPIVLMGHSMGGMYIRDYAAHYPENLSGLILMDSSIPLQFMADPSGGPNLTMLLVIYKTIYIVGVPRLIGQCSHPIPGMPIHAGKILAQDGCQPHLNAILHEFQNVKMSAEETIHSGPFGALPILIISEDTAKARSMQNPPKQVVEWANTWDQWQEDLKKLSTRSRRIIAKGSGHEVHGDREDLVLREVPLFIEQIRGTAPQPANYGSTSTE